MEIKVNYIKEIILSEMKNWKRQEIIALFFVFTVIFINAYIVKDNIIAVISAVCGILYSTIAGKGRVSCYYFGLTGTCCYSWLSFENALWGNLILYLCYYFPMQIAGIFSWKRHLKQHKKEIIKEKMTNMQRLKLTAFAFVMCVFAILLIKYFNGSSPVFDGITTVLSVFGMYLTVKRFIEQWIIWMIVNGLSALMWINIVMHGTKAYATCIMWCVYFILAIYFYREWSKEIGART